VKESILIIINGKKRSYPYDANPNEIMSDILLSMPNLNYWPYPSLKSLYLGIMDMLVNFYHPITKSVKGSAKTKTTKFLKQVNSVKKYFPKNQPDLLRKIYESCLINEGLGTLRGFGFTNRFGDNLSGNPEIHSILKGGNLIRKER